MTKAAVAKDEALKKPSAGQARPKPAVATKRASAVKTTKAVKAVKAVKVAKPETAAAKPAPAVKAKPEPKAKPEAEQKEKPKKAKLVRDSFTMPEAEYAVLGEVKKACLKAGIEVKKSELLRVGVALIRQLDTAKLKEILAGLPALKAGRPKKSK